MTEDKKELFIRELNERTFNMKEEVKEAAIQEERDSEQATV